MTITYLKKATRTAETGQTDVRAAVETLLARIDAGGEDAVRQLAAEMDRWTGPVVVTPDELAAAIARVPVSVPMFSANQMNNATRKNPSSMFMRWRKRKTL